VIRSGFGAGFTGTVTPNAVRFFFNTDEGQAWPDIFETIGPNAHFSPEAVGTLVKSGANWSATWSGLAYIYDTTGPYPRTATHQCFSTQHGLLLTPVAGQMRK